MAIAASDYATTQAATVVFAVPATLRAQVRNISLTVPSGQSASISIGSFVIARTRGSTNISYRYPQQGAAGDDITITCSGAASVTAEYDLV